MVTILNRTEQKTKDYFDSNGIFLNKVPESKIKTPDFENDDILVEVKAITPHELEGLHADSTYNAIKNNLQDAAKKFRDYDPDHIKKHIVVIFAESIVKEDIFSVWTGNFSPSIPDRIFSSGMLLSNSHKLHIDSVAWYKNVLSKLPNHVWIINEEMKKFFPGVI